jgi:hypothetical protein
VGLFFSPVTTRGNTVVGHCKNDGLQIYVQWQGMSVVEMQWQTEVKVKDKIVPVLN